MDLLGDYRTEIDKIDKEMTKLLEKRMNISKSISKYKMEHDMQIFHPDILSGFPDFHHCTADLPHAYNYEKA